MQEGRAPCQIDHFDRILETLTLILHQFLSETGENISQNGYGPG